MLPIKKILFPSSFWGIFDFIFFVFFNYFGKKNKGMLHYNGGMSVTNIQSQGTKTILMLKIMILGKTPPGAKGVKTQKKSATRLAYKVKRGKIIPESTLLKK
jgi:hypothetical protein